MQDGWPVVSPERYAGTDGPAVDVKKLVNDLELTDFDYRIVPGFAGKQTDPDFSESSTIGGSRRQPLGGMLMEAPARCQ